MALIGTFSWYNSLHQGGKKAISFSLYSDNHFQNETFDCAIIDSKGQLTPQIRRQITLKPKQSFRFDYDSCGWDWCVGDFFAILGENDRIKKRWNLNLQMYKPGECPECHGTKKCKYCNGSGMVHYKHVHTYSQCTVCDGNGVCQTCYIPIRQDSNDLITNANMGMPSPNINRQRKIEGLRQVISDLQSRIEKVKWDLRIMEIRGRDVSQTMVYRSQQDLLHQYKIQLIHAQSELQQLENL